MEDKANIFDHQYLTIQNDKWTIELEYESPYSNNKYLQSEKYDTVFSDNDDIESNWMGWLAIRILENGALLRKGLIQVKTGGLYLHIKEKNEPGQSVKLEGDKLMLSCGSVFLSLQLPQLKLNWKIQPDAAAIFEFYDLEEAFLLRGELEIHKITQTGEVEWSFGGRDIWVNPDGKPEVEILDSYIKLVDFQGNEYKVGYDGKEIK